MCGADEVARPVRSPAGLLAPGRTLRAPPHPNGNATYRTSERFLSGAARYDLRGPSRVPPEETDDRTGSRPAPGGGRPVTELASTMTPREVASQAAEAIRALNHLTYGGGEQRARCLVAQQEDGQVRHGSGADPDLSVTEVMEALNAAGQAADMMTAALEEAHNTATELRPAL